MSLKEFLLARIAEDAERASVHLDPLTTQAGGMIRVRAECEAKRQIIELLEDYDRDEYTLWHVMCKLALPYADHPDYRQAWR